MTMRAGGSGAEGTVRFDDFEIDLDTLSLSCAGRPVLLPRQPALVLCHLARHAGTIVPRADLQELLWPDKIVEHDAGLNTCIRQIRRALGDEAAEPRYLETIPRVGYRFHAQAAAPSRPRSSWRRRMFTGGALAAALAIAAVAVIATRSPAPPRPDRFAVLPFAVVGPGLDASLAEGLRTELTHRLAEALAPPDLVIADAESQRFAGSSLPLYRIGDELAATYLVTGSLRGETERVRVLLSLVSVGSQGQLWTEAFDDSFADPVTAQQAIAAEAVEHILERSPALRRTTAGR